MLSKKKELKPNKPKKATNLLKASKSHCLSDWWWKGPVRWGALNVSFSSVFTSLGWPWTNSHQPKDSLWLSQCQRSPRESRGFIPLPGLPCEQQGWSNTVSWHLLLFSTGRGGGCQLANSAALCFTSCCLAQQHRPQRAVTTASSCVGWQ